MISKSQRNPYRQSWFFIYGLLETNACLLFSEYVSSNVTTTSSTETVKELKDEPKKDVVDLTVSDSDDDEPLAKRRALNPKPDSTIKFSGIISRT